MSTSLTDSPQNLESSLDEKNISINAQINELIDSKFNFIHSNAPSVVLQNIFKASPHLLTILRDCFPDDLQYKRVLRFERICKSEKSKKKCKTSTEDYVGVKWLINLLKKKKTAKISSKVIKLIQKRLEEYVTKFNKNNLYGSVAQYQEEQYQILDDCLGIIEQIVNQYLENKEKPPISLSSPPFKRFKNGSIHNVFVSQFCTRVDCKTKEYVDGVFTLSGMCTACQEKMKETIKINPEESEEEYAENTQSSKKTRGIKVLYEVNLTGELFNNSLDRKKRQKEVIDKMIMYVCHKRPDLNPFSGRTVVIDEVHNIISGIRNTNSYANQRIYYLLYYAVNVRYILLSGTPLINNPYEAVLLVNLLSGTEREYSILLPPTILIKSKGFEKELRYKQPSLRINRYVKIGNIVKFTLHLSSFHQSSVTKDRQFKSVTYHDKKPYLSVEEILNTIKQIMWIYHKSSFTKKGKKPPQTKSEWMQSIVITSMKHSKLPDFLGKHELKSSQSPETWKFPSLETSLQEANDEFNGIFIDSRTGIIKNKKLFQERCLGLISYFGRVKEIPGKVMFPKQQYLSQPIQPTEPNFRSELHRHSRPKQIKVFFSTYQFAIYLTKRKREIRQENRSGRKFKNQRETQSYKVQTRQVCNIVYPNHVQRPIINQYSSIKLYAKYRELSTKCFTMNNLRLQTEEQSMVAQAICRYYLHPETQNLIQEESLQEISPKYAQMLNHILYSDGSCFLYSEFRSVEGIELICRCLESNGMEPFPLTTEQQSILEKKHALSQLVAKQNLVCMNTAQDGPDNIDSEWICGRVIGVDVEFIRNTLEDYHQITEESSVKKDLFRTIYQEQKPIVEQLIQYIQDQFNLTTNLYQQYEYFLNKRKQYRINTGWKQKHLNVLQLFLDEVNEEIIKETLETGQTLQKAILEKKKLVLGRLLEIKNRPGGKKRLLETYRNLEIDQDLDPERITLAFSKSGSDPEDFFTEISRQFEELTFELTQTKQIQKIVQEKIIELQEKFVTELTLYYKLSDESNDEPNDELSGGGKFYSQDSNYRDSTTLLEPNIMKQLSLSEHYHSNYDSIGMKESISDSHNMSGGIGEDELIGADIVNECHQQIDSFLQSLQYTEDSILTGFLQLTELEIDENPQMKSYLLSLLKEHILPNLQVQVFLFSTNEVTVSTPENIKICTYAPYTGGNKENNIITKEAFNQDNNRYGQTIRVIMITSSGAEGISLLNVQQTHILEPYWNRVRIEQVIGRAARTNSHKDLPADKQSIDIFEYYMTFSPEQQQQLPSDIVNIDSNEDTVLTTDETLYAISLKKTRVLRQLLQLLKESAVDCQFHLGVNQLLSENKKLKCYEQDDNVQGEFNIPLPLEIPRESEFDRQYLIKFPYIMTAPIRVTLPDQTTKQGEHLCLIELNSLFDIDRQIITLKQEIDSMGIDLEERNLTIEESQTINKKMEQIQQLLSTIETPRFVYNYQYPTQRIGIYSQIKENQDCQVTFLQSERLEEFYNQQNHLLNLLSNQSESIQQLLRDARLTEREYYRLVIDMVKFYENKILQGGSYPSQELLSYSNFSLF